MKANNLRKLYLVYMIVIGELFCGVFIACSWFVQAELLQTLLRVVGFAGAALIPVIMFIFYKWLAKDGSATSDEREQLVLRKAFSVTGFVALTSLPLVVLFAFLFPSAALYFLLAYGIAIGGTCKLCVFYFYKKY